MKKLFAVGLSAAALCASARADDNAEKFEHNVQQLQRDTQARFDAAVPPSQSTLIDYGGYLTLGYLSFDDAAHNNHGLWQYELTEYGRVNFDNGQEFYARGREDYFDYNPGDSFDRRPDRLEGRVEEGYYRFDLARYNHTPQGQADQSDLTIKGGRQFVSWGNGLTLDQYVDGIRGEIRAGPVGVDLLAGVTVKETIDFDETRPEFDRNTHRGYFGGKITLPTGRQNPYAYFLLQRDFNRDESETAHIISTRYRYNSYYAGIGSNGALSDNLAYGAEFTYEGGNDLSNSYNSANNNPVSQSDDRIEAYALNVRLEYLLNDPRKTRFSAQALLASGDPDRQTSAGTFGGNKPHTVDNAFNGLGVIYDGLAFAPPVSNLLMFRVGGSTFPFPQGRFHGLEMGADFFLFGKTRTDAPIDEPTQNSLYLGCEPDVFINWQVTEDVTFTFRYGLFFPGAAIPSGDQDHVRQFLYAAVTYAF